MSCLPVTPLKRLEQPGMYVSPDTLAMHLRVLKRHFEIVDLGDWLRRQRDGSALPDRACCITFDDGWRDNFQHGFPVLRAARVPATIFLVADFIGTRYRFWPNRLATLLGTLDRARLPRLPRRAARCPRAGAVCRWGRRNAGLAGAAGPGDQCLQEPS